MVTVMTPTPARPVPPRRRSWLPLTAFVVLTALLVGGVLAGGVWWLGRQGVLPIFAVCQTTVGDTTVRLDREQAENAATIAAVGVQRGLPGRAVTIALATAYQESDLRNLDYGDRDSLGVFQQRPSQGWGTARQVRDVRYASDRFYDELLKIDYRDMRITEAAQAVQRSAFPEHYAKHEPEARALASSLTGWSPATLACSVDTSGHRVQTVGEAGFTKRAESVRRDLTASFGSYQMSTYQSPAGTGTHDRGIAVDVFAPMADGKGSPTGWAMAHYLVANADRLAVAMVIYDDRIWTARRAAEGWREYRHPSGSTTATDRHLDHLHVEVVEGS